jgi:hypothetical protein
VTSAMVTDRYKLQKKWFVVVTDLQVGKGILQSIRGCAICHLPCNIGMWRMQVEGVFDRVADFPRPHHSVEIDSFAVLRIENIKPGQVPCLC